MTTKVVIDSFDKQEQAVAFVEWLKRQFNLGRPRLICTDNVYIPAWDGIDSAQTNTGQITMNIVVDYCDGE